MPSEYHHLSYILFRLDSEETPILAARCPEDERFSEGVNLIQALRLDEEAQLYLFRPTAEPPMIVQSCMGVGVLDKRYRGQAGVGIYWHVHGRPDSLARLINHGVLGNPEGGTYSLSRGIADVAGEARREDVSAYPILNDAWGVIDRIPGEWALCDERGCLYATTLLQLMRDMADFAGCRLMPIENVQPDGGPVARIQCRRPELLEILLFCLLTEVQTYSLTGEAFYRIGALGNLEGEGLALDLSYPIEKTQKTCTRLEQIHRHLTRVADLGGLEMHAKVSRPQWGGIKQGEPYEVHIALEWTRDPAVLPTSDLKAEIPFEKDLFSSDGNGTEGSESFYDE